MDEIKTLPQNVNNGQGGQNAQNGQGGGRRRRKKHKRGGNGNANGGQNNQNHQNNQNNQNGQNNQNNQNGKNAPAPQHAVQPQHAPQPAQKQQNNNGNNNNNNNNNTQKQNNKNKKQKQNNQNQNQNQNQNKDDNRKDTYAYTLDGNLYINLTNKCSNGCDFCVRNERTSYYGNYLWIRHGDPTVEKVIAAVNGMGDLTRFKEAVFCGFGEPTYKVAEMVALCDYFHEKGLKTRLNTNGQGNLINKRDITIELKDKIDLVNVSLNASCAEKYQPICRSQYGESAFAAIVDFAKLCKRNGINCRFSIVDCIGEEEVEACKRLAESVKIPLYVRKYITDS